MPVPVHFRCQSELDPSQAFCLSGSIRISRVIPLSGLRTGRRNAPCMLQWLDDMSAFVLTLSVKYS